MTARSVWAAVVAVPLVLTCTSAYGATTVASKPIARLTFAIQVPADHQSSPGISKARIPAGKVTVIRCAVTDQGPATAHDLTLRLFAETSHPDRWRVLAHRNGAPRSEITPDVGTVRRGGSAVVRLYVEPTSRAAGLLAIGCFAESADGVRIKQPTIDRAGDKGAALQVRTR